MSYFNLFFLTFLTAQPCDLRKFPDGYVCVCNATFCDTLEDVAPEQGSAVLVSSSQGGLRFQVKRLNYQQSLSTSGSNNVPEVIIRDAFEGPQQEVFKIHCNAWTVLLYLILFSD